MKTGALSITNLTLFCLLTVQVDINTNKPTVSGGGLPATYTALQLHFHWGPNDNEGSEHTFRGRKFPLEVTIRGDTLIFNTSFIMYKNINANDDFK